MKTTWKVTEVRAVEGLTEAKLVRGFWFKRNPDYDAQMAEWDKVKERDGVDAADEAFADEPVYEEFLDLDGPEPGAEWIEGGEGSMTLHITDGLDMKPGDAVRVTLDVLDRVPS